MATHGGVQGGVQGRSPQQEAGRQPSSHSTVQEKTQSGCLHTCVLGAARKTVSTLLQSRAKQGTSGSLPNKYCAGVWGQTRCGCRVSHAVDCDKDAAQHNNLRSRRLTADPHNAGTQRVTTNNSTTKKQQQANQVLATLASSHPTGASTWRHFWGGRRLLASQRGAYRHSQITQNVLQVCRSTQRDVCDAENVQVAGYRPHPPGWHVPKPTQTSYFRSQHPHHQAADTSSTIKQYKQ